MNKKFIVFGLIVLVAIAAMCAAPGSNQQQSGTQTTQQQTETSSNSGSTSSGEVLFNEKYTLKPLYYLTNKIPVTKNTKVDISFESIDGDTLEMYIIDSTQHNYLIVYGLTNLIKYNNYMKAYSGKEATFQYTFPEDGLYYLLIYNINDFQTQFYYSGTIVSGEKLEKYEYIISQGTNTSYSKDGWRVYATYLQKGEKINIYYSVRQNEYRNLFIKMFVFDSNGYTSWKRSPVDYSGKIYFDSINDRERSYEQLTWTAPEKGYYYIVFWNRDSPESLRLDYKIYKD
jgi:hypothetical protein